MISLNFWALHLQRVFLMRNYGFIWKIQTSSTKLSKLGKKKLLKNNILLLDIDNRGILSKSIFIDKDKMNKIKFTKDTTQMSYSKNSFIYDFLYSVRQKINDPLWEKKNKII